MSQDNLIIDCEMAVISFYDDEFNSTTVRVEGKALDELKQICIKEMQLEVSEEMRLINRYFKSTKGGFLYTINDIKKHIESKENVDLSRLKLNAALLDLGYERIRAGSTLGVLSCGYFLKKKQNKETLRSY